MPRLKHQHIDIPASLARAREIATEYGSSPEYAALAGHYQSKFEIAAEAHNRLVDRLNAVDHAYEPLSTQIYALAALAKSQSNHAAYLILDELADAVAGGTADSLGNAWLTGDTAREARRQADFRAAASAFALPDDTEELAELVSAAVDH